MLDEQTNKKIVKRTFKLLPDVKNIFSFWKAVFAFSYPVSPILVKVILLWNLNCLYGLICTSPMSVLFRKASFQIKWWWPICLLGCISSGWLWRTVQDSLTLPLSPSWSSHLSRHAVSNCFEINMPSCPVFFGKFKTLRHNQILFLAVF